MKVTGSQYLRNTSLPCEILKRFCIISRRKATKTRKTMTQEQVTRILTDICEDNEKNVQLFLERNSPHSIEARETV